MSIATPPVTRTFDLLHAPAIEAAAFAPRESEELLALLGQPADDAGMPVAHILAALARLRIALLGAGVPEAGRLWEVLRDASIDLRGQLIDGLRASSTERIEQAISAVRELAGTAGDGFGVLDGIFDEPGPLVAVAGDFKRGKSTLINALLGRRVLPTRVAPATAVPCLLRAGPEPRARVYRRGEAEPEIVAVEEIERYACIVLPGNDEDRLAFRSEVERVEIDLASMLPPGVTLVDLPGLNEEQGRSATARDALDRADIVVMVLAANQLLAEDELQLIETLWSQGHRSLTFAVNYIDGLEEHEIRTVRERCAALLSSYGGVIGQTIFLVSARHALLAQVGGSPLLPETGVEALEAHLKHILAGLDTPTWRVSRLRQVVHRLDGAEEETGLEVLRRQEAMRQMSAELASISGRLGKAERIYADGDIATAHDIAMRRQRIADHDALFEDRWALLESALRERFRRESLAWIWQKARDWLRDDLIRAIREVNPQVTPRPEGYLRISVAPGLRVGRDALLTFYLREAAREWERFTASAQQARRRELEEALAEAEREAKRLMDNREANWAPLAARRAALREALATEASATTAAVKQAAVAAEALRAALDAIGQGS